MESEDKKKYEISFLIRDEAETPELLKILKQHGAEILFEGHLRKINLAYKIRKEASAYFGYLHFSAAPGAIAGLEEALRTKVSILRYLIVTPPFARMKSQQRERPREAAPASPAQLSAMPLSNEALEKKIEEILQ